MNDTPIQIEAPEVIRLGNNFAFVFPNGIRIRLNGIHQHSDASTTARIEVAMDPPEYRRYLLINKITLTTDVNVKNIVKALYERASAFNWKNIMDYVCLKTQIMLAEGTPSVPARSDAPVKQVQFLAFPYLIKQECTVIFGPGGSFKSWFAQALCSMVQLGRQAWPMAKSLGLRVPERSTPVLWCDWETDRDTFERRISLLSMGHELPRHAIQYLRLSSGLAHVVDQLHREVITHKIGLAVVDSMGMAAGGDINTQQIASDFFTALRSLEVTTLVITHEAKSELIKRKTPYGSVYVENEARNVWRVQKEQNEGDSTALLKLLHHKANDIRRMPPRNYFLQLEGHFDHNSEEFIQDWTRFKAADEAAAKTFEESGTVSDKILRALEDGPMTRQAIYDLNIGKEGTVKAKLNDLCHKNKIGHTKDEDSFRLLEELPL